MATFYLLNFHEKGLKISGNHNFQTGTVAEYVPITCCHLATETGKMKVRESGRKQCFSIEINLTDFLQKKIDKKY